MKAFANDQLNMKLTFQREENIVGRGENFYDNCVFHGSDNGDDDNDDSFCPFPNDKF